jgi:thiol-disulfide isomerase/thioredoxin
MAWPQKIELALVMPKRITFISLCSLALIAALSITLPQTPPAAARDQAKPSGALKEVDARQRETLKNFERDVKSGRARPEDLEARLESLKSFAAERAAGFKVADWAGEELYALGTLHQWAEQFAPASEAFRAYLRGGATGDNAIGARVSLSRASLELDRVEEAALALAGLERTLPPNAVRDQELLVTRIALHKDLALAYRDRGQHAQAAAEAELGYRLIKRTGRSEEMEPLLREARDYDYAALAALVLTSYTRLGKKAEAGAFARQLERELSLQPKLRPIYEAELASARLIGSAAPELKVARWLDAEPMTFNSLRGKVVVLDFWAMWCGPCVAAFPHWRQLQEKYESRGLVVVGLTRFYGRSDKEDDLTTEQEWKSLQEFKRRHQLRYPIAVAARDDLTNDDHFGVISLPTVILIDRRGTVRLIKRGSGDYRKLDQLVSKLIAESP